MFAYIGEALQVYFYLFVTIILANILDFFIRILHDIWYIVTMEIARGSKKL